MRRGRRGAVFALAAIALGLCLCSCSIDYGAGGAKVKQAIPEMILTAADFSRIEKGARTVQLHSEVLELFNEEDAVFGKGVNFRAFDRDGTCTASGGGGYLSVDNKAGVYLLLGGAQIESASQNCLLEAQNLRWNSNTEQLCADSQSAVTVKRTTEGAAGGDSAESTVLVASGGAFAFSAFDLRYGFGADLKGILVFGEDFEEND